MVQPIKPDEVAEAKREALPDFVLTTVNELVAKHWNGSQARILQKDIVAELVQYVDRAAIFAEHYLDFEDVYRAAGWKVLYDKPGYNETYDASFTFTKSP